MKRIVTRRRYGVQVGSFFAAMMCTSIGQADPPTHFPTEGDQPSGAAKSLAHPKDKDGAASWKSLVGHWEACVFGGDGPVEITEKLISVGYGDPLTGVRWKESFPKENYELEVEAQRTDGFDFFCAITFPVGETHCTLVMGGWGGGVLGLSNIDGNDASDNSSTQFRVFDDDKWYRARVRVTPEKIVCWIDDKQVIEQERKDHEFGIRYEMDPCVPLGIAAYQCDAEYRNIRWRSLDHPQDTKPEEQAK